MSLTVEEVEDLLAAKKTWDDISKDEVNLWVEVLARAHLLAGVPLLARARKLKALWLAAKRRSTKLLLNDYLRLHFQGIEKETKELINLSVDNAQFDKWKKDKSTAFLEQTKKEDVKGTIFGFGLTDEDKNLRTLLLMYAYYHSSNRKRLFQYKWDDKYIFRQAALRRRLKVDEEITMLDPPEEAKASYRATIAKAAVGVVVGMSSVATTMAYFMFANPELFNSLTDYYYGNGTKINGTAGLVHGDHSDDAEEDSDEDDEDEEVYYYYDSDDDDEDDEKKKESQIPYHPNYYE